MTNNNHFILYQSYLSHNLIPQDIVMFNELLEIPVFKSKLKNRRKSDDVKDFINNRDFNQFRRKVTVNHLKMKKKVKSDIKNCRSLVEIQEVIGDSNLFAWINPDMKTMKEVHNFQTKDNDIISTFFSVTVCFVDGKIIVDFISKTYAVIPLNNRIFLKFNDVNKNMFARLKITG